MKEYKKDYENWSEVKEILEDVNFLLSCNEREIWWVSFGVNIGIEIDGKGDMFERPAIIIKKYNKEHIWVIPLTSADFIIRPGIHVPIYHQALPVEYSVAVISQLQSTSGRRLTSFIGTLSIAQFIKILEAVKEVLPKYTKDLV